MCANKFLPKILTVGSWNIEGLYEKTNQIKRCKLDGNTIKKTLRNFDILCLQETHIGNHEILKEVKDFHMVPHCRKISTNNRYFGGYLVLIRKSIRQGVKITETNDEDVFELVLLKTFFGLESDTKVIFAYASPLNSCYTKGRPENVIDALENKTLNNDTNCLIMGDLNGRTKEIDDFVRDQNDDHSPINNVPYISDKCMNRRNMDPTPVDQQGKKILDFCKAASYRILNGRTTGDQTGKFTRYPSNLNDEPHVIDYALCGTSLLQRIHSFSILPFTGLSDHCCLSTSIRINQQISNQEPLPECKLNKQDVKYTYDSNKRDKYIENVLSDTTLSKLNNFLHEELEIKQDQIDKSVLLLNDILLTAAKKSFPPKRGANRKRPSQTKGQTWYTRECMKYKKLLRNSSKLMSKYPFEKTLRKKFVKNRTAYKKACRQAEKNFRRKLTMQLLELGQTNPRSFWNIINKMNRWGRETSDPADKIAPHVWKKHFEELLNGGQNEALTTDPTLEFNTFDPALDSLISEKELRDALHEMKCKKSPGPDGILTEYLKIFGDIAAPILLKIIRIMFANHTYPTKWSLNFLKPIFKKDDTEDTHNYRGLAIGSALAKLYSLILLKRLINYMTTNKIISPNQIGFMKGCRTSDHILLLQTLIEKVVKKNHKKLFCAFVDFKKAYDTVDRGTLLRRLQDIGINGLFYKNIAAMYLNTEYSIKLQNGFLDPIKSNLGLKQGCPLSPMLFNIYIDDVKNIFDNCDPIDFQGKPLSHFLYADDLVLVSSTASGLQNCLFKLQDFSRAKSLTINVTKTKTMVFNHTGRLLKHEFTISNKKLELVHTFCYLGFDIKTSGVVSAAIDTLCEKANKAMRPLKGVISRFNIPVKTSIQLFHTYIAPILLYTSENWLALSDKTLNNFAEKTICIDTATKKTDILHRQFLKYIIGTSRSCPNLAIYGETGELPISLKAYKLMLKYWQRVSNLPNDTLVKMALLENIQLRTNWIMTIEKLLNCLKLTDTIENTNKFNKTADINIKNLFINYWGEAIRDQSLSRLEFYSRIKETPSFETYLDLPKFEHRKTIAKLRCSDHALEIEKGRHRKTNRENRLCKACEMGEIETEDHFLTKCKLYEDLKIKHNININTDSISLIRDTTPEVLGKYLLDAWSEREKAIDPPQQISTDGN